MLIKGSIKETKPMTAKRMPNAVNQPHPGIPSLRSSNEFANLLMPENNSHIPKTNGMVSAVNS